MRRREKSVATSLGGAPSEGLPGSRGISGTAHDRADWSPGRQVDLERLLKLRLAVARIGEMDVARWWNTSGQVGSLGAKVLSRGMPRTHRFAQARSVFSQATRSASPELRRDSVARFSD